MWFARSHDPPISGYDSSTGDRSGHGYLLVARMGWRWRECVFVNVCACSDPRRDELDVPRTASLAGYNVVLISLDTLRADHLHAWGYPRDTSPNIDRLASESIVFDRCVAPAPTTLPSHMSLLTGIYPSRHGVLVAEDRLPDEILTFVDVFHGAGSSTAAFTGGGFVREKFNYHTFDIFRHGSYWSTGDQGDRETFDEMIDWVGRQNGPFFVFWHTYKVHSPYAPAPGNDRFADPDYDGPVDTYPDPNAPDCPDRSERGCFWKHHQYYDRLLPHMDADDIQLVIDRYDAEIVEIDRRVGVFMEELQRLSLDDRTIVVLLSDHGESFADRQSRQRIGHRDMYEEVLRVPLMIRVPGVQPVRITDRTAELVDVMPTLLALLGLQVSHDGDGTDLIQGGTLPPIEMTRISSTSG